MQNYSKRVDPAVLSILNEFVRPRVLGKEDGVFDIGYEAAKARLKTDLEAHLGRTPWTPR